MTVRTRFAPSPTGVLHIGSVRTALYCWLYARHHNGEFVLRIEDTDRERSTQASVDTILDGMSWLGMTADEGPFFQSERYERYQQVINEWLQDGKAYRCYCTKEELDERREAQIARGEKPRYDGRCRDRTEPRNGVDPVVRFRNPVDGDVVVNDAVKGEVTFANAELDDLVIARSDGSPTYNFSVVIDDADMRISHVMRGDDHLNNTPRQINMLKALGAALPVYAHLPMILGEDGAKLSKRHGAVNVLDYRDRGYLPSAMLNYLVRLGWSHGDQELFEQAEMVALFDLPGVNRSASTFNASKLDWINQQHIQRASAALLVAPLAEQYAAANIDTSNGPALTAVIEAYRERATTLHEMALATRYCFMDFEEFDPGSAKKHLRPVALEALQRVRSKLANVDPWGPDGVSAAVHGAAEELGLGMGKVGQPVRVAVTGASMSPSLDVTLDLVGKERALARLDRAIEFVEERAKAST
ncbi:MAG: glutamate--tRNA ligase [Pseudomonadota bacterium]